MNITRCWVVFALSILLFGVTACSSNDSEFIVGEWVVESRINENGAITSGTCDPYVIYVFNKDTSMVTYLSGSDGVEGNVICGTFPLGIYEWEKLGDGTFRSYHISSSSNLEVFYKKEGSSLKAEYPSLGTKAIFVRRMRESIIVTP